MSGALGLQPTPDFRAIVKPIDVHAERGVNGPLYDGRYGAYQYGEAPCPADFDHNGFVNGDDADGFAIAFDAGDPAADFDGNGFVNGDDADAFMISFESGC
jgi:hypothetical protein